MPSRSASASAAIVPGDQQRAVVALDDRRRLVRIGVRRELAGDRGEQVGGRHDAFEMAVFVVDQRHRHLGLAQRDQRVHRVDLVDHDRRLAHQRAQVERLAARTAPRRCRAPGRRRSPHRSTLRATGSRRVRRSPAACARMPASSSVDVEPVDLGPRRHHLAHRPVGQPHDARDDRALMLLDHARLATPRRRSGGVPRR